LGAEPAFLCWLLARYASVLAMMNAFFFTSSGFFNVPFAHFLLLLLFLGSDPFALDKYVDRNIFLADINNEGPNKNPTYKKNVLTLDNFVMSYSTADTVPFPTTQ
jgi:hypothetical protein